MAKRRKAPPARPAVGATGEEHSLLLRSAESLGRVIGALQRQLDDATRRLASTRNNHRPAGAGSDGAAARGAEKRQTAHRATAGKSAGMAAARGKTTGARKPAAKRKRSTR
jgi:hypothetical protein